MTGDELGIWSRVGHMLALGVAATALAVGGVVAVVEAVRGR